MDDSYPTTLLLRVCDSSPSPPATHDRAAQREDALYTSRDWLSQHPHAIPPASTTELPPQKHDGRRFSSDVAHIISYVHDLQSAFSRHHFTCVLTYTCVYTPRRYEDFSEKHFSFTHPQATTPPHPVKPIHRSGRRSKVSSPPSSAPGVMPDARALEGAEHHQNGQRPALTQWRSKTMNDWVATQEVATVQGTVDEVDAARGEPGFGWRECRQSLLSLVSARTY